VEVKFADFLRIVDGQIVEDDPYGMVCRFVLQVGLMDQLR
jgi:hypothetical protein